MIKKPLCFVISPIGEAGTQVRQDADDLLELIIRPALDIFNFDIVRGDHRSEANQIDIDVIKSVQDAEICVADISRDNVNVFYEVGRRDETGKPLILLRAKNAGQMPVDLGTRRYIEYDLDSRRGIGDARQQLRNFVQPLVDAQFEGGSASSSLSDIAAILQRVERKLDRITKTAGSQGGGAVAPLTSLPAGSNPKDVFKLARQENNVALMEQCLDHIKPIVDRWVFLDYYVELTAAKGSIKAGEILIANASEFMDESSLDFHKKVDYVSYLVTFANKADREQELLPLFVDLFERLEAMSEGQAADDIATIYNQKNRLYYGIFLATKDTSWLTKAEAALQIAAEYAPTKSYIVYNLALCYMNMEGRMEMAKTCIDKVLALDAESGKDDANHLDNAIRIYRALEDPGVPDLIERLRVVDPVKARLIESQT